MTTRKQRNYQKARGGGRGAGEKYDRHRMKDQVKDAEDSEKSDVCA